MKNCTTCLIDGTDACPRGAGRAVDDEICDSYIYDIVTPRKSYLKAYQQGRADAIDEIIKTIDEQNYCMQEECPFNACRFEGCPINRNAEVIFQTWLKKLKEQK